MTGRAWRRGGAAPADRRRRTAWRETARRRRPRWSRAPRGWRGAAPATSAAPHGRVGALAPTSPIPSRPSSRCSRRAGPERHARPALALATAEDVGADVDGGVRARRWGSQPAASVGARGAAGGAAAADRARGVDRGAGWRVRGRRAVRRRCHAAARLARDVPGARVARARRWTSRPRGSRSSTGGGSCRCA